MSEAVPPETLPASTEIEASKGDDKVKERQVHTPHTHLSRQKKGEVILTPLVRSSPYLVRTSQR